ncbi:carboxypeptidase regulatory-like domain-containing protein [Candidatus Woesearchaeota archaeon]|nr:carboxypeptidase regulatory-like domain-containing protein [Candidatus Woesearchaeota archaeon]
MYLTDLFLTDGDDDNLYIGVSKNITLKRGTRNLDLKENKSERIDKQISTVFILVSLLLWVPSVSASNTILTASAGFDSTNVGLLGILKPINHDVNIASGVAYTNLLSSGCCLSTGLWFCTDTDSAQCCSDQSPDCDGQLRVGETCGNVPECQPTYQGCCLTNCLIQSRTACPPPNGFGTDPIDCSAYQECQEDLGCCVLYNGDPLQGGIADQCYPEPGDLQNPNGVSRDECYDQDGLIAEFYSGIDPENCTSNYCSGALKTGTIFGNVVDVLNQQPLLGAIVEVVTTNMSTTTDANGNYRLENVHTGNIWLRITATGYEPVLDKSVVLTVDQELNKNYTLVPGATNGTVEGYVKSTSGTPISGAYVSMSTNQSNGVHTDTNGFFIMPGIAPGDPSLVASSVGYSAQTKTVSVSAGMTSSLNFSLQQGTDPGDGPDPGSSQCTQNGGHCYYYDFQCEGTVGAYSCDTGYLGCCMNNYHSMPQCWPGDRIVNNDFTSWGWATDPTHCECEAGTFYDITQGANDQRFCCANETSRFISTSACATTAIMTGYVFDENGAPLGSVTIKLDAAQSTSSQTSGLYYIDMVTPGTYDVEVSKDGYITVVEQVTLTAGETVEKNFTLQTATCSAQMILSPVLTSSNVIGEEVIVLNWTHQCPEYVYQFYLYRDSMLVSTFTNAIFSYIDTEVTWGSSYTYKVVVQSTLSQTNTSNTITASPGNSICSGKDSDDEFCMSSAKDLTPPLGIRAGCDYNNNPVSLDNGDCALAYGIGSICIGPDANNETYCSASVECPDKPHTYLGLYYDKNTCELNASSPTGRDFCYMDQSQTTIVDRCYNCYSGMSCYEYESEDACETDNCYASQDGCYWQPDYFAEYGSGFCYKENYTGTDKCSLCGSSELFKNVYCNASVCGKLGNCYSQSDKKSCLACITGQNSCEDYTDQVDCLGAGSVPFEIPGSSCETSDNFTFSTDSCHHGVCKWISGACYKDADDDGTPDCGTTSPTLTCTRDVSPPISTLTGIPSYVNSEGVNLTFSVSDANLINSTKYCISDAEDCCPSYDVLNGTVAVPNIEYPLTDVEANRYIRFFSKDENANVETIKSYRLYFDTKVPDIDVTYEVLNNSYSNETSNIYINVTVDEYAVCSDEMIPDIEGTSSLFSGETFFPNEPEDYAFSNVRDGVYQYCVSCTDIYDNNDTKCFDIDVDRINLIMSASPINLTTSSPNVTLEITTSDKFYCEVATDQGYKPFNSDGLGILDPSSGIYMYTYNVTNAASGTYMYNARCKDTQGSFDTVDQAYIYFTVDTLAPSTRAFEYIGAGQYEEMTSGGYYMDPSIRLICVDTEQDFPPGEFGCSNTYYCVGETAAACSGAMVTYDGIFELNTDFDNSMFCYMSTDKGGNSESLKCIDIYVDNDPPSIQVTAPLNGTTFSNPNITVGGIVTDESRISMTITVESVETGRSDYKHPRIQGTAFDADIRLYPGMNRLIFEAEDEYGNTNETILYVSYVMQINFTIQTTDYDSLGLPVVLRGETDVEYYNVDIVSGDPITVNSLIYEVFDTYSGSTPEINLTDYFVLKSGNNQTYRLFVPVSNTAFDQIEGNNSHFIIEAEDDAGNTFDSDFIVKGKYFDIDTFGGYQVELTPQLSDPYYADGPTLRLTGFTSPRQENQLVHTEVQSQNYLTLEQTNKEYNTTSSYADTELSTGEVYADVVAGSTTFQVSENREADFVVGRYVQFPVLTPTYERYKITGAVFNAGDYATTITLDQPIQSSVTALSTVYVYDLKVPTGWFEQNIDLVVGENNVNMFTMDSYGNVGVEKSFEVIYDNYDIEFMSVEPHNESTTNNLRKPITMYLLDRITGVDQSSLVLTVDGSDYTCSSSNMYCTTEGYKVFMTYTPTQDYSEGTHNLKVYAKDKGGDSNQIEWWFEIKSGLVSDPTFSFDNANYVYNRWYTNSSTPKAYIHFLDQPQSVTPTDVRIYNTSIMLSATKINDTSFSIDFPYTGTEDGSYSLEFNANVEINETTEMEGQWFEYFVIDTTAPVLQVTSHPPTKELRIELEGNYLDLNMDETSTITMEGDINNTPFVIVDPSRSFSTVVDLDSGSDGIRNITVFATDFAGNIGTTQTTVTYDTTCSPYSITRIYPTSTGILSLVDEVYVSNIVETDGISIDGSLSELSDIKLYFNNQSSPDKTYTNQIGTSILQLTLLSEGTNVIRISSVDIAGNDECDSYITINRDTTGPTAELEVWPDYTTQAGWSGW